ncbi:hypothetical protein Pst134EA_002825 [Puccinia striiformis f. sp. tritici]|uniref:hypothetical protein n=1 Tax=Puccinia striiformis f. sp. tritici TaxID=168172 RepID=UPI0020078521|nr:hypothetical protein Pst134EA_002825 [Puccinia striiformis f. sp. tritici]KAH9472202.1 hypothetical protein Pst134EA_002825 [Puccinia striiformis f. sp. tritici]
MRSPSPTYFYCFSALCSLLLGAIGGAQAQNATSCRSRKTKPHARITPIVSAYYPGYNAKFLPVENIPWKMYDHLQYFVAVPAPTPEGDLLIDTEQNMVEVIAAGKKNNVSISLSIGGWTGSRSFSFLVGDQKNRTTFVGTIERAVKKYGLDGIDLDWEYPNFQGIGCNAINKNDSENFLAFLKALRAKLGPKFRLSAAVSMKGFMSADGKTYLTDVSEFAKVLNFFTIMAYDVYGSSFSKLAGPNSPLFSTCSEPTQKFSVAQAIKQWTSTGVPARQLLLGIPSYGYGYTLSSNKIVPSQFSGKAGVTSQLFQPHADTVPAGGKTAGEATGADICGTPNVAGGQWLFKELSETGKLSKNQKEGLNGYERHYDNCTHTPFLFNPSTKNLISYDDSFSLKEKASYAVEHGLGGVEMFDATGDTADSQLLKSVRKALLPRKKNSQHGLRCRNSNEQANSPEKPTKKLRKLRDDSSPRNRSSVSSFASSSSYVLVSSRETFICETRPLEVPPNVIQTPVSVEISPTQPIRKAPLGPRKRSPPRTPAARAPIQTRRKTAAALHSDLPLPSEETADVFINPHFEEPSSPIVPVTVEGSSSSREPDSEECLADFPEPKQTVR